MAVFNLIDTANNLHQDVLAKSGKNSNNSSENTQISSPNSIADAKYMQKETAMLKEFKDIEKAEKDLFDKIEKLTNGFNAGTINSMKKDQFKVEANGNKIEKTIPPTEEWKKANWNYRMRPTSNLTNKKSPSSMKFCPPTRPLYCVPIEVVLTTKTELRVCI